MTSTLENSGLSVPLSYSIMKHLVILAAICGFSQAASIEKSTDVGVNPTVCLITHCGLQSFNCWREQGKQIEYGCLFLRNHFCHAVV